MFNFKESVFGSLLNLSPPKEDKFDDPEKLNDDVVELKNSDEPEADAFNISQLSWGVNFDVRAKTVYDLITMYRRATVNFEIEDAIDEIVGECVIKEPDDVVDIDLDKVELSDSIKKKIKEAFDEIIQLMNFNNQGDEYFRKWYTDGRIYFQLIIDKDAEKQGIKKIKVLSPFDIVRIKVDSKLETFATKNNVDLKGRFAYIWKENERRLEGCADTKALKRYDYGKKETGFLISDAMITFVPSGMTDHSGRMFISPLHKSLKPLNQLRLLEDAAVIYRITRAPERRVFFIDVGKLPKKKADAYVQKLIRGFKTKVHYDAGTGQLSTKRNILNMIQDYYLPTNSDQKGTKIETLEGGTQLGQIDDIFYFKKKLYKSLKVPIERIDDEENPAVQIGTSGEMPRKELKFAKFCNNLRFKFSAVFMDMVEKQLIYKNVMKKADFAKIKNDIKFIWQQDSYYEELKESEILVNRVEAANELEPYIHKYFSNLYVKKNIFRMTDDQIEEEEKQIAEEQKDGEEPPEVDAAVTAAQGNEPIPGEEEPAPGEGEPPAKAPVEKPPAGDEE